MHTKSPESALQALAQFVITHQPLFILTGAGCSTASGLADYRDRSGNWKRQQPMSGSTFINDERARQRYWARSIAGWPVFETAQPNAAHQSLTSLQARGFEQQLVTQNVDGLHQQSGHENVIDLHGNLATVYCLDCAQKQSRRDYQRQLLQNNPGLETLLLANESTSAPDGDADLQFESETELAIPNCSCGGLMKPNVVFFGENVPRKRVENSLDSLQRSRGMLVVGSSLMVYSGYRFCKRAAEAAIPIASVNLGVTRADDLLRLNVQGDCTDLIPQLLTRL